MVRLRLCNRVCLLALLLAAGLAVGCGAAARLDLVGSDTMVTLAQAWAEAFHRRHPAISLPVSGGGSGVGFAALLNGYAHVTLASRPISPEEQAAARQRGLDPRPYVVGWDGLAIIVHPSNAVPPLTLAQVRALLTGQMQRWPDGRPVVVVTREVNSGTHLFMRTRILGGRAFATGALKLPSTQQVHDTVARTPGAIGYIGQGYLSPAVRAVPVALRPGAPPMLPTPAAVAAGRYPIRRPLYLYTAGPPAGAVAEFVRFALGPEGQRLVHEAGFVPIRGIE